MSISFVTKNKLVTNRYKELAAGDLEKEGTGQHGSLVILFAVWSRSGC